MRPLPPRPASAAAAPKARPIIKAHSEPPPGDCTQAYDQRDLSRLLLETDRNINSEKLSTYCAKDSARNFRPVQELPTVRPAAASRLDPSVEATLARTHKDTIPDDEDLTTAYVKHDSKAATSAGLRVEQLPPIDVKSDNASTTNAAGDANDVLSFAELSEELELSQPESIMPDAGVVTPVLGTPNLEAPVPEAESSAVVSEHTSPQARRPVSAHPAPGARRIAVRRHLLPGLLVVGAIGLVLTALTHRNGSGYGSARARIHSHWIQAHRTMARMFGGTTPVPKTVSANVRLVDISIVVEPPEAKLYLDGRAASNPLRLAYPADGMTHVLRAEAEGRMTVTQSVKFDRDVSVVLGLGFLAPEVPAKVP